MSARQVRAMVDGQASLIRTMLGQAPAPERPDVWLMVVGIPFETWCNAGECRGPAGYHHSANTLLWLTWARRLGLYRNAPRTLPWWV